MTRQQAIDAIRANPNVTVLIIGGGINGAGTFRDLALQGVDVLLVERADFCSGASAASSHMVHGGIRYLENGEFRLVREAVQERNRLLQNAPHAVKPLPTTIPIFNWSSGLLNAPLKFLGRRDRPTERGVLLIKIGLMLYDAYTRGQKSVPRHTFHGRRKSLQLYPQLNPAIAATATYYDAMMPSPERLCLEVIMDGQAASPDAYAINYMPAVDSDGETVVLRDELTGETLQVRPKIVVNAAGPWIDFANQKIARPTRFIGGTKGSHLVLEHPPLREAIGDHEFFFENDDGRIVLICPFQDKVLIGTSDIPIDDPDQARCTEEEVDYFLAMIRRIFPAILVERSHIVFRFAGVRPLPRSDAASAGQISRDHSIQLVEPGGRLHFPVYSLVGGKWTTFRAFAGEMTNLILQQLGRQRSQSTRDLPIGGGRGYPHTTLEKVGWFSSLAAETGLPRDRLETLFARYGTRAAEVAAYIAAGDDQPLRHHPAYSRREITFLAQNEMVVHLDDLFLRRTLIAMLGELSDELLLEQAEITAEALGWSDAQKQVEIDHSLVILAEEHRETFYRSNV